MSINRVSISGNLTRDPEHRATQSGMDVTSFGVAVNDRRKNPQTGEWEEFPNFIDCTIFGTRGPKLAPYLSKGSKVAIDGKLRYSSWERDGQKRSKLEVIVDEIELMSGQQTYGAAPQPMQPPVPMQQGYYAAPQPMQQMPPVQPAQPPVQQPMQPPVPVQQPTPAQPPAQQMAVPAVYDDDIPF